jgi:hypothetical protein
MDEILASVCYDNYLLPSKLGSWINPSHRIWRWHFHAASKTLLCRVPGGAHIYGPRSGLYPDCALPRFTNIGDLRWLFHPLKAMSCVHALSNRIIPSYSVPPAQIFLKRFEWLRTSTPSFFHGGGHWMWDELVLKGTFQSIIAAVKNGSAIWVTDGSFNRV